MSELPSPIDPAALSGYLASRGWQQDGSWRGAHIWTQPDRGRLLVPEHVEYADDAELLQTAVIKLAGIEDRAPREIMLDIAEPEMDVPVFRLQPDTPSGTIPLPSAMKAIQGIHDALKVSAQTVELGPRLLYTGQRSRYIDHFLRRVRIGTTRAGSYVFDARVPIGAPPRLTLDELWNNELPGRHVMTTFYQAIVAVHTAAANVAGDQAGFGLLDDGTEQGVSANLCSALGNLGGVDKNRPFDVGITWARAEVPELPSTTLSFSPGMVRTLVAASSELEKLAKSGRATVTGIVETLTWPDGEGPRVRIKGALHASNETFQRSIWVVLTPDDYRRAFDAHDAKRQLRVTGQLVPDRKRLEMRPDPGGFDVL
ncbi:hypothetical protein ACFYO1_26435 [Nocardia sp. NPDC006044]|uniref:hypothetical protein n=1 Tax=Nocardia sp. NPDC006044 TaxID=3364306 RepID=UPI0036D1B13C